MQYRELIHEIKSAFAQAPAPADDKIICHQCDECLALWNYVRGRTPDELEDFWLERSFDQLPFLADDAKRYYFPAFLRFAALKPDSLVAQFVLYSLADDFRMRPSGGYSEQQKQAVRDFLVFIEAQVDESGQEYVAKAKSLWQAFIS